MLQARAVAGESAYHCALTRMRMRCASGVGHVTLVDALAMDN
jgi:hypothetical protein